jgi:hypothetical protein
LPRVDNDELVFALPRSDEYLGRDIREAEMRRTVRSAECWRISSWRKKEPCAMEGIVVSLGKAVLVGEAWWKAVRFPSSSTNCRV